MGTLDQHTPGPWESGECTIKTNQHIDGQQIIRHSFYVKKVNGLNIAELSGSAYHSQLEANARLMAAAPDLLDALIWTAGYIAEIPPGKHVDHIISGDICMACYRDDVNTHIDAALNKVRPNP